MGERCQHFSRAVEKKLTEGYPGGTPNLSVVLAPSPLHMLDSQVGATEAWERTVEYLAASGTYPDHLFFRVSQFSKAGGVASIPTEGRYEIEAGKTYALELLHYRPNPSDNKRGLDLIADRDAIEIHGSERVTVSSGYDRVAIRFLATLCDDPKDTTLIVEPAPGEAGTTIKIDLRINPTRTDKIVRGSIGTVAILVATLPAVVYDFSGAALGLTVAGVTFGAAATGWLTTRRRNSIASRLLPHFACTGTTSLVRVNTALIR